MVLHNFSTPCSPWLSNLVALLFTHLFYSSFSTPLKRIVILCWNIVFLYITNARVWGPSVGNRVGVGLTRSTTRPLLPFLMPVKGASTKCPHNSEPLEARTGQDPWLRPGWKILPTRIGYCSNINNDHRFRCDNNNVAFTNVQPFYYHVWQVKLCYQLGWSSQALILSILALGATWTITAAAAAAKTTTTSMVPSRPTTSVIVNVLIVESEVQFK